MKKFLKLFLVLGLAFSPVLASDPDQPAQESSGKLAEVTAVATAAAVAAATKASGVYTVTGLGGKILCVFGLKGVLLMAIGGTVFLTYSAIRKFHSAILSVPSKSDVEAEFRVLEQKVSSKFSLLDSKVDGLMGALSPSGLVLTRVNALESNVNSLRDVTIAPLARSIDRLPQEISDRVTVYLPQLQHILSELIRVIAVDAESRKGNVAVLQEQHRATISLLERLTTVAAEINTRTSVTDATAVKRQELVDTLAKVQAFGYQMETQQRQLLEHQASVSSLVDKIRSSQQRLLDAPRVPSSD